MDSLSVASIVSSALLLVDTAPIIYTREGHRTLAARFVPLFLRHSAGDIVLAVKTTTIAEVLTGPLMADEEALARC
ncbi:MAG: hypothetical protein KGL13_06250 [Gammaproteobacteria bacterium]|nr:hypothetical protein [Gammaproteobacteria bacterium]MDE2346049.1 hypothetical protein [Gammaproteobacteria bacterium]